MCELLPRDIRCDSVQALPDGFARLVPSSPESSNGLPDSPASEPRSDQRRCPECGAVYDLELRPANGSTESPSPRVQLSRRVDSPRWEDLRHPVAYRRTDAAYALARQSGVDLGPLLDHPEAEIREHALQGLLSLSTLPEGLEIDRLLDDPEATVRALAVRLRWRQLKEDPDGASWDSLAQDLDRLPVDAVALLLGLVVHSEEPNREAFATFIERAAAHPDTELRKRAARGLAWLAEAGCDKPARIEALLKVMLEDPDWEVRLSGLSALSSMVDDWGDQQTPRVIEALSQALRDVKLRYTLFRAMGAVIDRHDVSSCLPSLIEIVLHDRSGYSDDASRLLCRALEKGLDRRQLVTELLPGLELADEGERGSVCVCYRTMIKRGWDLRPAYDAIFRRLLSSKASFVECDLAADLAGPLLVSARREDSDRLDSLLNASPDVAGAVTRALAALARGGRSLASVAPSLQALLNGPDWVAQGARMALDEHARNAGRRG